MAKADLERPAAPLISNDAALSPDGNRYTGLNRYTGTGNAGA